MSLPRTSPDFIPHSSAVAPTAATVTPADGRAVIGVLAADSLEGRGTGQRGSMVAARSIGAWLTGCERSTLGDGLRADGVPLVADPRPAQHFFQRSDDIVYAWLGIPAHTLSSYNLHADDHTPKDEADRLDYAHTAAVVNATVRAVRLMADGPRPAWKPGQRPQAPPDGRPVRRPAQLSGAASPAPLAGRHAIRM